MKEKLLEALLGSPVFGMMDLASVKSVLEGRIYQLKTYSPGSIIAQAGSPCDHARIIVEGQVSGEMLDISGKVLKIEDIEVSQMIAPAFMFGKRQKYPVNVVAADKVLIWQMHRDEFISFLQSDSRILNNYLNAISSRAQFLSEKIRFLSFPTLKSKIAFLLLQYANRDGSVDLPLTHQQMAEMFGVARPSLSREIRQLNEKGYIDANRKNIRILNSAALRSLVNRV